MWQLAVRTTALQIFYIEMHVYCGFRDVMFTLLSTLYWPQICMHMYSYAEGGIFAPLIIGVVVVVS